MSKIYNWVRCDRCKKETLHKFHRRGKYAFRCKCGAQIRHAVR